jgi:co-chaperonin GroES (HSP10)
LRFRLKNLRKARRRMIKPAGHRVLVKPDEVEEKVGSLYLAVETKERRANEQIFGTLVAIGANAWKAFDDGSAWAKVGDRVTFAKYGGFTIEDPVTKEKLRLLNDEDICAVVEG